MDLDDPGILPCVDGVAADERRLSRATRDACPAPANDFAIDVIAPLIEADSASVYLWSICHEPSQSGGGGLWRRISIRAARAFDGPSPGAASSAAVKAARASSQRRARYA